MDEATRSRQRPIRTLGRISTPSVEDILLAQWASGESDAHPQQDIAIASNWAGGESQNPFIQSSRAANAELIHDRAAVRAYENHMVEVVRRLLEAIDADVAQEGRIPLSYEAPPVSQDTALAALAALVAAEELTIKTAALKRDRILALCEASARLWVLAGLYRAGHISALDLASKRTIIANELK